MAYTQKIVMSIGGSLIVPEKGIDTQFLINLNKFIRSELAKNKNRQFFLVAGGGQMARRYRDAGEDVLKHRLTIEDLDWLGIHATRLNAQLLRTIFRDIAHPYLIKHYEIIRKVTERVVIAAGWKPGWSTDYDSVLLCEDYGIKEVINLCNVEKVYDKDPKKDPSAKAIDRASWKEFRKIVGDKWTPGMHAPFDPIAARKAQSLGVRVAVLSGYDFNNIKNYFNGKKFVGTVIE
jgi:uridylate kinase